MKLHLTYQDSGPRGICGQDMQITSRWRKLYIIEGENYEEIKKKVNDIEEKFPKCSRLNPKFIEFYWEDEIIYV